MSGAIEHHSRGLQLIGEGKHWMAFKHVNSKGATYYLHETDVNIGTGDPEKFYFFAKVEKNDKGTPADLPADRYVLEMPRNGFLTLSKGDSGNRRTRGDAPVHEAMMLDPSTGEGLFETFGYTVDPNGREFFIGNFRGLFLSPPSLSFRILSDAVRDPAITEKDLQEVLEAHPELIPGDYFDARPQIVLELDSDKRLIPDFMLQPVDDLWDVLEIKRPHIPMVAHSGRHTRFSHAMASAIQQVRDYSAALEDPAVRQRLLDRYEIEAYRPKVMLIAGRSVDLDPRLYRQLATQAASGIQMYTWDDVVEINRSRGRLRLPR